MRITPGQYALSLYELASEAKKDKIDEILKNFVALLARSNNLKLADKIEKEFVKLWDEKKGLAKVEVTTAGKLDKDIKEKLNFNIMKWLDKNKVEMEEKIDKDILGGIIVKYEDTVIDGSLRKKIEHLKQKLEK